MLSYKTRRRFESKLTSEAVNDMLEDLCYNSLEDCDSNQVTDSIDTYVGFTYSMNYVTVDYDKDKNDITVTWSELTPSSKKRVCRLCEQTYEDYGSDTDIIEVLGNTPFNELGEETSMHVSTKGISLGALRDELTSYLALAERDGYEILDFGESYWNEICSANESRRILRRNRQRH